MNKLLPVLSGLCCLLYIYGWTEDTTYPAWVPLVWCASCFVNDLHTYLESKNG